MLLLAASATLGMPTSAQMVGSLRASMRARASSPQNPQIVAEQLTAIVAAGRLDDLRWPDFPDYQSRLQTFYGPSGYKPAWLRDGKPTPQGLELIRILKDADREGLQPEDYDASRWAHRLTVLRGVHSDADEARFDAALSVCVMRYVSNLQVGRINPQHLDFEFRVGDQKLNLPAFVRQRLVAGSDLPSQLAEVGPQFAACQRLRSALQHYMELAKRDTGEKLPVSAPVSPGEPYAGIARLASLLRLLGDLPENTTIPPGSDIYEGALVDAVKHFQTRHDLQPTGQLDPSTVAEMNVPLIDRLDQMRLALERYRWLPYNVEQPRIEINVPEFRLYGFDAGDHLALTMNVNVGAQYNYQTPLFEKDMQYIVFRPYWYPPPTILREAILPELKRKPSLDDIDLELIRANGKVIRSGHITPAMLQLMRSGKMTVRQQPGRGNSEGLVKFIFPNEYHVYIHDTPDDTKMFSDKERGFSHGCIQVQEPARLAAWVLRNNRGWDLERVERAMHQGRNNVRVDLASPVPVQIVYETAIVDANGNVRFVHDIYGNDAILEGKLAHGYPYPK